MREILFRGKRKDNGRWIQGSLFTRGEQAYIIPIPIITSKTEVDPDTVGQFTGMTDGGNKKLFEHDVVTAKFKANGARYNFKIVFKNGYFLFDNGYVAVLLNEIRSVRKIGNIHDNPELIGGVNNE